MQHEKHIYLTIYVFCIAKCSLIIGAWYPQSNKKEKETEDGKYKNETKTI